MDVHNYPFLCRLRLHASPSKHISARLLQLILFSAHSLVVHCQLRRLDSVFVRAFIVGWHFGK